MDVEESELSIEKSASEIPIRYFVALLISLGIIIVDVNNYSLFESEKHFTAFSSVERQVVPQESENSTPVLEEEQETEKCDLEPITFDAFVPIKGEKFNWTSKDSMHIHDAFFYSWALGFIPGAFLGDRYGGRNVFGVPALISFTTSIVKPIYVKSTGGEPIGLAIAQAIAGMCSGIMFPTAFSLLSQWMPKADLGKVCGMMFVTDNIYEVTTAPMTDFIIRQTQTFSTSFFIYAGVGFVWSLAWFIYVYSSYRQSPHVGLKEYEYLQDRLAPHLNFGRKRLPFRYMWKSKPFWAFMIAVLGESLMKNFALPQLSEYTAAVLYYDPTVQFSTWIHVSTIILVFVAGILSDVLSDRGYINTTLCRKIFTTFGGVGPMTFILAASFAGCRRKTTSGLYIVAMVFKTCFVVGASVNVLDLAPNYTGLLISLKYCIVIASLKAKPYVHDVVKANKTSLKGIRDLLLFSFLGSFLMFMIFVLFGSAEIQPFNDPEKLRKEQIEARGRRSSHTPDGSDVTSEML